MINEYAIKLIENMPDCVKNHDTQLVLDIILDGGAFNGSYLLGALYFLKEMERRGYVKVERLSGCSIGSLVGFLYLIDSLDSMTELYETVYKEIKRTHNFNILKQLKALLGDKIPADVCEKVNNRLYITYNNVQNGTKPVKHEYSNVDDLMNTIIKSSFIPFVTDGQATYKDKYIDGINPFIFKQEKQEKKEEKKNKKTLFLNLSSLNKIGHIWNVKNEQTNYHRTLSGMLDIHHFFIKQSNTEMCSYVEDWNTPRHCIQGFKKIIEFAIIKIVYIVLYFRRFQVEDQLLYKILKTIIRDVYVIILETYCI